MKKKSTTVYYAANPKKPTRLTKKQRVALDAITDDQIDYSDIPPLDKKFYTLANALTPSSKRSLTLRLDSDIYEWLKAQGPGYQTRINAMLKAIMLIQEKRI